MSISMRFKYPGAEITKLNVRKEGHADDRILAIDVRLRGEAAMGAWLTELFLPRVEADFDALTYDLVGLLWLDDEDRNVRTVGVTKYASEREFLGCVLHYGLERREMGIAKRFKVKPLAGEICQVEFTFSISMPDLKLVALFAEMVGESSPCELVGNDLLSQQDATA